VVTSGGTLLTCNLFRITTTTLRPRSSKIWKIQLLSHRLYFMENCALVFTDNPFQGKFRAKSSVKIFRPRFVCNFILVQIRIAISDRQKLRCNLKEDFIKFHCYSSSLTTKRTCQKERKRPTAFRLVSSIDIVIYQWCLLTRMLMVA
jgi:hypothetical protein